MDSLGHRSCPGCASINARPLLAVGGYQYLECQVCSLATLNSAQVQDSRSIYTADYFEAGANSGYTDYASDEPIHRINARLHLNRLGRAGGRPPGVLLDLGCAAGFFMSEASRRGWQVYGVDISPWARQRVREHLGFTVFESVEEAGEHLQNRVDAITAFQVLEHIPDLKSTIMSLRRILKPGGRLLIETWDRASTTARILGNRWQQLSPPSVVHLFDSTSLNNLLAFHGFRRSLLGRMAKVLSAGWAAGLVASKVGSEGLSRLATRRLLRRIPIPYFLDDLVYLVTTPAETILEGGFLGQTRGLGNASLSKTLRSSTGHTLSFLEAKPWLEVSRVTT